MRSAGVWWRTRIHHTGEGTLARHTATLGKRRAGRPSRLANISRCILKCTRRGSSRCYIPGVCTPPAATVLVSLVFLRRTLCSYLLPAFLVAACLRCYLPIAYLLDRTPAV